MPIYLSILVYLINFIGLGGTLCINHFIISCIYLDIYNFAIIMYFNESTRNNCIIYNFQKPQVFSDPDKHSLRDVTNRFGIIISTFFSIIGTITWDTYSTNKMRYTCESYCLLLLLFTVEMNLHPLQSHYNLKLIIHLKLLIDTNQSYPLYLQLKFLCA